MPTITFTFQDQPDMTLSVAPGESVLQAAKKANVAIDAPCSGNGSCGKCKITLTGGQAKDYTPSRHVTPQEYGEGIRLACMTYPEGDVTVSVPDIAGAYRSRMKIADLSGADEVRIFNQTWKAVEDAGIAFTNNFSLTRVEMDPPSFDDVAPDAERFRKAAAKACGASPVRLTPHALRRLPSKLREGEFRVDAVVRRLDSGAIQVMDVFAPGEDARPAALVVDIGTTTVSALLADLATGRIIAKASSGNGQIRYGADVIHRIIEQSKPGGVSRLRDAVISETVNPIVSLMTAQARIDSDSVYLAVIASNTTMNHLACAVNADNLRMEPFVPVFLTEDSFTARDLGIEINESAEIVIAPNIASYVGGDITAGTLSSMIWNQDEFCLFLDLGTNGEIVFGNRDFLMACACSAGPAFEGGDISCGMRASDGAIEKFSIDRESMEPAFEVIGGVEPAGICGSGLIDVIAGLFTAGVINSKGRFIRRGPRVRTDDYGISSYVLAVQASGREISVNEIDIDNFIRAKGAIFSAVRTMLSSIDMDVSVISRVYVAGGIGSGINMANAIAIGMFPDISTDLYEYIGNSSLSGAYCMAMSSHARSKVFELASSMTYIELSNVPDYMGEFVAACFLPHTDERLFPSVTVRSGGGE